MLDGYADPARLAYGLPAALIVLGLAEAGRRSQVIVPPQLIVLGNASYSIYLFQLVFIGIVSQLMLVSGLHRWMPELFTFPLMVATAMAGGISADQLAELELAYAPPFSSAKDPINMLGYMAENVRSGACDVVAYDELGELVSRGWTVLDVRTTSEHARAAIPGSTNIPLDRLRAELDGATGPFVVYCEVGQRGHTATALLHELGIESRNLDGGYRTWLAADLARRGRPEALVGQPA